MSNVLNETKQQQVVTLGQLGWSLRRIEKATGVRRETAAGYLKAAGIAVREPGGWGRNGLPAKPANEVTTGSVEQEPVEPADPANPIATGASSAETGQEPKPANEVTTGSEPAKPSPSLCEPYREMIEDQLRQGRNAMSIYQYLVDRHGFTGSYQSVKRFVRGCLGPASPQARAVIQTAPGEEAQSDYGKGPLILDPVTGKYRASRLFVMTLGYSRKSIRLLVMKSSSQIWCELHQEAFRRLGGSPRTIVLDNLAEGVLEPDIHDPRINPLFRDFLAHYGVVAMPCKVADPDRKGKVESGVGHAKRTLLKGKKYASLEQGQDELDHWEQRWADTRVHGSTKRQVAAMFAEEKPSLQPLPVEPFRFYEYGTRTVHMDGCVEVNAAYYSVPPGFIGHQLPVQWDQHTIRILHPRTRQLLREHSPQPRGTHRILPQDKTAKTPPQVLLLLDRARRAGPKTGQLCQTMHDEQGPVAVRRIQGVVALHNRHGTARVEQACAIAIEAGLSEYRLVRRLVERDIASPVGLAQVDPLIRQLTAYRDLIAERTAGEPAQPQQKELFKDESD